MAMRAQKLRTGMHIKIGGQEYNIEQRLPNGDLQLKHLASETFSAKPEAEIIKLVFDGGAELLGSNGEVNHLEKRYAQSLVNDFAALEDTDPRKKEALHKLKYIEGIRGCGITKFGKNDQNLRPVIDEVSKAIDDPQPPSCGTLARWHRDYTASGDDIRVLPPAYKARGRVSENDGRRISDDLATCQAVDKIIDNSRRGNRRGTKNPPEGVSQGLQKACESSAADDCLSDLPSVPIIHTAEEDLDLEDWESDYDLPGSKR